MFYPVLEICYDAAEHEKALRDLENGPQPIRARVLLDLFSNTNYMPPFKKHLLRSNLFQMTFFILLLFFYFLLLLLAVKLIFSLLLLLLVLLLSLLRYHKCSLFHCSIQKKSSNLVLTNS